MTLISISLSITSFKYHEITIRCDASMTLTQQEYIRRAFGVYHLLAGPLHDLKTYQARVLHATSQDLCPIELLSFSPSTKVVALFGQRMPLFDGFVYKNIRASTMDLTVSFPSQVKQPLNEAKRWLQAKSRGEVLLAACNLALYLSDLKQEYSTLIIRERATNTLVSAVHLDSLLSFPLESYL